MSRSVSHVIIFRILVLLVVAIISQPLVAGAQTPSGADAIMLSYYPQRPTPGEQVTVTASSQLYDLTKLQTVWMRDGQEVESGKGVLQVDITAPRSGATTRVTFSAGGSTASAYVDIAPTEIDLLFEAESYIPPFFRGRALPLTPAKIRAQAIPHLQQGGSPIPSAQLYYSWRVNGTTVKGVSGKGKSVALLPSPVLFGADTISVDVGTSAGVVLDSASVRVVSARPLATLYQDHPLLGIIYHRSLPAQTHLASGDVTLVAVPYFAAITTLTEPVLRYVWKVNNFLAPEEVVSQNMITIAEKRFGKNVALDLNIEHLQSPLYSDIESWRLILSSSDSTSGGPDKNPFRPQ